MAKIRFEFETEDFYGEVDLANLKNSLGEVLAEIEDESVVDAATISIVKEDGGPSDDQIREAAVGLISNGTLEVGVRIADLDGTLIFKQNFSSSED